MNGRGTISSRISRALPAVPATIKAVPRRIRTTVPPPPTEEEEERQRMELEAKQAARLSREQARRCRRCRGACVGRVSARILEDLEA